MTFIEKLNFKNSLSIKLYQIDNDKYPYMGISAKMTQGGYKKDYIVKLFEKDDLTELKEELSSIGIGKIISVDFNSSELKHFIKTHSL